MGRKGVSKRKKAKVKQKGAPVSEGISTLFDRKAETQTEHGTEKVKAGQKGSKKP
jgi:hypothetical protein